MADGIPCKHCGYQESEHVLMENVEKPRHRIPGYRKSIFSCSSGGYDPEFELKEDPRVERATMAHYEREARSRAA